MELVREGNLAADVEVRIVEGDDLFEGGPFLPPAEAKKLDAVRHVLRSGDIMAAIHLAAVSICSGIKKITLEIITKIKEG